MKAVLRHPDLQVWVCVNERDANGLASCGSERGEKLFAELQKTFRTYGAQKQLEIWVNKTLCQGFCNASGVSVLIEPLGLRWQGVLSGDVANLMAEVDKKRHP